MTGLHALAMLALRRPLATLLLVALATLGLSLGLLRLRSEVGYRGLLGASHPAVRELDAHVARFGGGLPFAAVWSCRESTPCESVFDASSLGMAFEVATALAAVPGVGRVDSPATTGLMMPQDFGLPEARRLAPGGRPARDLEALAARARLDPTWAGQIVSADALAGAVLVHLEDSEGATAERALTALRALIAPHEAQGYRFHLVGGPVEFVVAGGELTRATALLVPLMVGIVAAILVGLFRSGWAAILALASVGPAVVGTLGLQGWLGWPQTSLTQVLPPLLLVIGVGDAMHVMAGYATRLAHAPDATRARREQVLLAGLSRVATPCTLTSLTTAAGFGSFAVSRLESLAHVGLLAAFGVIVALLLCFSLLPILVVRLPARRVASRRASESWERGLERLVSPSRRRPAVVLLAAALLAALGAWGFARLRVDASFEELYGEQSQVVQWARAAAHHLRAPETLEIGVQVPEGVDPTSTQALEVLERVEGLASLPGLGAPLSILQPLREVHRLVHREPLVLGRSEPARPERLLRLLAAEEPDLVELLVDRRGGALRVSFQSAKLPQAELRVLLEDVQRHLDGVLPPGYGVSVTGPLATVAVMIDEIRRTQLESFGLAGALILLLLGLFFRSGRLALLALVPTLLPVVVTLGAMGIVGVPLDVGSAMVAAVVLGLAVDDAIHLLFAYATGRRAGQGIEPAIVAAIGAVGRPLVSTSLALLTGFAVLAFSPWRSVASFGLLSAVAILAALLADLLVLPALLVATARLRARAARPH